ncbi:MAG: endonuclease/exonuclease/phosphatase family protein, partial [Pirellulaceae bacterium]
FVYAITSTKIVKLNRHTGEPVAESRGSAKHLNSGFFHKGKLYAAHSNYPRVPERSELMVLDPETMELATFKDFGNFGGSLTWAVRHDGDWWCTFAKYGEENAETFIVRFDDNWNELARYTFPAELIARLGNYSLSGGIWRGDELLVTGHDDPILFRLRLPAQDAKQPSVMRLVGEVSAPFTGQGIAVDPLTGGLVGISRKRREVVFAVAQQEPPKQIRVLSYNIHHGRGMDDKVDLARLAKIIQSVRPDIVALQEVDRNVERSAQVDQPAELAKLTGMQVVFGGNIPLQGGDYGNALLSRWPIHRSQNHLLPNTDGGEQRGVLEAEINVPGHATPLLFLNTHLDHRRADAQRLDSAKQINQWVEKSPRRPALLAGDLNATPESPTLGEFKKHWTPSNTEPRLTIPVKEPNRQIDFVLFSPEDRWTVVETTVLNEPVASDHLPILAVLELGD